MSDSSEVKMGRSLVKSIVGKSRKVVKKSIGKVFDIGALDHLADRLLEKSTALAVLDERVSSAYRSILSHHRSKCPSPNPQYDKEETAMTKKELKEENGTNEETLIPSPKGRLNSFDDAISSSILAEEPVHHYSLQASKEEDDDDDDDDGGGDNDGVCKERGDYSSCSEEEFKEMVEGFIQRFNQQIAHEYNSTCHSRPHPQEIVFMPPLNILGPYENVEGRV